MSDQTKPRVWNAGDPEPEGVAMVRDCMGDTWTREPVLGGPDVWMSAETHTMTWERIAKKYAPLAEVQSSSPVHGPSEDGNASEASSQPGGTVLFSEREDRIYRTDPMIVDLWQVYAPVEEIHDHDLPIDTVKIGEPDRVRADAAEAKLAEIRHLLAPFWLYACQVHHYEDALQKIRKIVKSEHPEAGR